MQTTSGSQEFFSVAASSARAAAGRHARFEGIDELTVSTMSRASGTPVMAVLAI